MIMMRNRGLYVPISAGPVLGPHNMIKDNEGSGHSPEVTAALTTQASGSFFLATNGGDTINQPHVPTDTFGNIWQQDGQVTVIGYPGQAWSAYTMRTGAIGGANHKLTFSRAGTNNPTGECTAEFLEVKGATSCAFVHNYPTSGTTPTSSPITVTGPAVLVCIWCGDGSVTSMTCVPRAPFTTLDANLVWGSGTGVQSTVAAAAVGAGTYSCVWDLSPNQGSNMWLYAFQ